MSLEITHDEAQRIVAHALRECPQEACGFLLGRGEQREVWPCTNVQEARHRRDPKERPSTEAYRIAWSDVMALAVRRTVGWHPVVLYHSHVSRPPTFSEDDHGQARGRDGRPRDASLLYLVVSLEGWPVRAPTFGAYGWHENDIVQVPLTIRSAHEGHAEA